MLKMLSLGNFVKDLRLKANDGGKPLTQQEVARKAGVDDSLVSFLESNKVVRFETLRAICRKGLSINDNDWNTIKLLWLEQVSKEPVFSESMTSSRKALELRERADTQEFLIQVEGALSRNIAVLEENNLKEVFLEFASNPQLLATLPSIHDLYKSVTGK